jgi:hypothetical protein
VDRDRLKLLLAVIALAGVALAVIGSSAAWRGGPAAKPNKAVAGKLYVSTGGSDYGPCSQAKPCQSFLRAYQTAQPGQVIEVAGGDYGEQSIQGDWQAASTQPILFQPAAGAKVNVTGGVYILGSHVEFRDMAFKDGWQAKGGKDITLRNISAGSMFIFSASNVRVLGGEVGPGQGLDFDSIISSAAEAGATPPTNILIDGVYFHDWWRPAGTDFHTECLQVGSGINVTIQNSRFQHCATHDIFIRSWGEANGAQHQLRNWLIQNNYFDKTLDGFYIMQIAEGSDPKQPCENFIIRNNSALQPIYSGCPAGGATGIRIESNIFPNMAKYACQSTTARWDYNIYGSGVKCGPHDRIAASGFMNPDALDLRLKKGAPAINRGNPKSFPKRDIQGHRRPIGKKPDAGAVEAG